MILITNIYKLVPVWTLVLLGKLIASGVAHRL